MSQGIPDLSLATNRASGNRERILEAALRLFTSHGFHGTPTSQISKEARVSTGTLFHYFPDKNTLIDQLYLSIQKEVAEGMRKNDDRSLPTKQRLEQFLRGYIAWGVAHPEKVRFMEQFYNSPSIGDEVKHQAYNEIRWLLEVSDAAIREGILRDLPPRFYTVMVLQILNGILALIASENTGLSPDEIIEYSLEMIWKR
ncbi:MAG: TetR/AcrR family transcriptional regulator [Methanomicrobiales archaeon]